MYCQRQFEEHKCEMCLKIFLTSSILKKHVMFVPNLSPGLNVESVGTVLKMPSDCTIIRKVTCRNPILVLFAPSAGNFVLVQLSSSSICTLIQELNLIPVKYVTKNLELQRI